MRRMSRRWVDAPPSVPSRSSPPARLRRAVPVVVGPGGGGVLFHEACGHGLEADLVGKGASVFANRVGEQVASPLVTLIDDGTMAGEWGHFAIDDEGRPAGHNVLIQDGVLTDYMWDQLRPARRVVCPRETAAARATSTSRWCG